MAGQHKGPLRIAFEDFLETFRFGKIISNWFKDAGEIQEQEINLINEDLMKIILNTEGIPDVIRRLADYKPGDDLQGGILTAAGFAGTVGSAAAGGILAPVVNILNHAMEGFIHSQRPDIQTIIAARKRGVIDDKLFDKVQADIGWWNEYVEMFEGLALRLFGAGELITLWRREEISETELDIRLGEQFFDDATIAELKILSEIIPGVSDLIGMAVREAFNDETAEMFGYDDAFPTQILEFTRAQSLGDEWVRRMWRAHWVLPSVGQAFNMLHRLRSKTTDVPFTDQHLELLLTALDIPVFWRERLTEISYQPLTRVDVRRMHALGKLDLAGVKAAYMDTGFNEENAQLMTDFTEAYNADDKKTIAKGKILEAYKKGLFTEAETLDLLLTTGLDQASAEFHLNIATFDILSKQTTQKIELIHDYFIMGEINEITAQGDLNTLDLPVSQVSLLIEDWSLEKLKKIRLPTETELEKFYKLGYIDDPVYRSGLEDRNYKADTIDWFIRQADQDIVIEAQKAEKEAVEIKEKLIADGSLGEYRISRSNLDVLIAAERANIAELKLLSYEIEDPEVLEEMKLTILQINLLIKQYQLGKAGLKLEREIEISPEEE